jgi:hypothetical protein
MMAQETEIDFMNEEGGLEGGASVSFLAKAPLRHQMEIIVENLHQLVESLLSAGTPGLEEPGERFYLA